MYNYMYVWIHTYVCVCIYTFVCMYVRVCVECLLLQSHSTKFEQNWSTKPPRDRTCEILTVCDMTVIYSPILTLGLLAYKRSNVTGTFSEPKNFIGCSESIVLETLNR